MRRFTGFTSFAALGAAAAFAMSAACTSPVVHHADTALPSAADAGGAVDSPQDFCGAANALPARCSGTEPTACDKQIVGACSDVAKLVNAPLLAAAGECLASSACGTEPTTCLAKSLAKAQPSDAQKALAKAYCATCAGAPGADCENGFFDAASSATAQLVLPLGDDVANAIAAACVTGSCKASFLACAQATATKALGAALSADTAKCLLASISGNFQAAGSPSGGKPSAEDAGAPIVDASSDAAPVGGPTTAPPGGWDVKVLDAVVPATREDGSSWGTFGGLPNPYVEIDVTNADGSLTTGTSTPDNRTLTPQWDQTILNGVPDLSMVAVKMLHHRTVLSDVWIGDCVPVEGLALGNGDLTFTCSASDTLYGPGFTLRYQVSPHAN